MLLHLVKLLPVCIVAFAISRRLDRQNIIKPDGADPFVPRSISHQILAAVLHTDKNAQGNNLLRGGALPAPVDGFDLDGLFSVHRLKQSVQNLTVQRPGDIVMLEHKVFLMGIGFIQQKEPITPQGATSEKSQAHLYRQAEPWPHGGTAMFLRTDLYR